MISPIRTLALSAAALVTGSIAQAGHAPSVLPPATPHSYSTPSYDGGYGSAYLAKMIGQKRAREIFFLGRNYSAQEAYEMGMVNAVIAHDELEETAFQWAQEILAKSPTSIKMLKFAFNLLDDGLVGQQVFAGEATRLAYMTEEAKEGRNAFLEKRKPIWHQEGEA